MGRAEDFIKEHTRNCSNVLEGYRSKGVSIPSYCVPWLTPGQARKAVEIAREEMIERAVKWIETNYSLYEGISGYYVAKDLKQAMKDEVS